MLLAKKRKFAKAVARGSSYTAAAIHAGYSAKTAKVTGSKLASEPEVAALIEQLKAEAYQAMAKITPPPEDGEKVTAYDDPLEFLKAVMNDGRQDIEIRKDAAKALMPYVHSKKGEGGKKEQKLDAAKKAAARFAGIEAPKLVVNNKG